MQNTNYSKKRKIIHDRSDDQIVKIKVIKSWSSRSSPSSAYPLGSLLPRRFHVDTSVVAIQFLPNGYVYTYKNSKICWQPKVGLGHPNTLPNLGTQYWRQDLGGYLGDLAQLGAVNKSYWIDTLVSISLYLFPLSVQRSFLFFHRDCS